VGEVKKRAQQDRRKRERNVMTLSFIVKKAKKNLLGKKKLGRKERERGSNGKIKGGFVHELAFKRIRES